MTLNVEANFEIEPNLEIFGLKDVIPEFYLITEIRVYICFVILIHRLLRVN